MQGIGHCSPMQGMSSKHIFDPAPNLIKISYRCTDFQYKRGLALITRAAEASSQFDEQSVSHAYAKRGKEI